MELSDLCSRVARNWISRAGILAGVEGLSTRGLSGVQPLAGCALLWGSGLAELGH